MRVYNFFVSGHTFQEFFYLTGDELPLITPFTACQYLYAFQRYSRSKSKAFLSHQNLDVFCPLKLLRKRCTTSTKGLPDLKHTKWVMGVGTNLPFF